jgi:hypothetical protein
MTTEASIRDSTVEHIVVQESLTVSAATSSTYRFAGTMSVAIGIATLAGGLLLPESGSGGAVCDVWGDDVALMQLASPGLRVEAEEPAASWDSAVPVDREDPGRHAKYLELSSLLDAWEDGDVEYDDAVIAALEEEDSVKGDRVASDSPSA